MKDAAKFYALRELEDYGFDEHEKTAIAERFATLFEGHGTHGAACKKIAGALGCHVEKVAEGAMRSAWFAFWAGMGVAFELGMRLEAEGESSGGLVH